MKIEPKHSRTEISAEDKGGLIAAKRLGAAGSSGDTNSDPEESNSDVEPSAAANSSIDSSTTDETGLVCGPHILVPWRRYFADRGQRNTYECVKYLAEYGSQHRD